MFDITNRRIRGQAWRLEKKLDGKDTAIASASETITGADILVLIAIVKFIIDNPDRVVASPVEYANGETETLLSIKTTLTFFLDHYCNHKNKNELIDTLRRLRTYQTEFNFYNKVGKREQLTSRSEHYLRSCVIKDNEVTFTISSVFLEIIMSKDEGWDINFQRLCQLSGIAQALYMFLSQNSGNYFNQSTLTDLLKLEETDFNNRSAIKNALAQLIKIKYLKPEDKGGFKVIKKSVGEYMFQIERVHHKKPKQADLT
jgi:hypothetical protein